MGAGGPPPTRPRIIPPLSLTATPKNSAGLAFSGGNPWVTMGSVDTARRDQWQSDLTALTTAHLWDGFQEQRDVGGKVDVLVERWSMASPEFRLPTRCVGTLTASARYCPRHQPALGKNIPTTQL